MIRMSLVTALAAALLAPAAHAQAVPDDAYRAEILGGWRTPDGTHMAALHLTLGEGWKTYWRAPGDSGIPPQFDWTGSDNIAGVTFHWPRPEVFDLNGLRTIGYSGDFVLPMEFTARGPGEMTVQAEVQLGVCRDVCVPVTLDFALPLPAPGAADPAIRAALDTVPRATQPKAIACTVEPIRDGLRLTARIDIDSAGGDEVAVMELADKSVWVSEALTRREGGRLTATADLVPATARPFALDRSSVTITILGSARALELRGCPA